ncbi:MAG TPA: DUF296 domain-containing protein [Spirochaetes bacterium]|nr:DUF296 domain-containing protein [Spirochaetota bacterium]
MDSYTFEIGRIFMGRFQMNDDLIKVLTQYCIDNKILTGHIQIIGRLLQARLSHYNPEQKKKNYVSIKKPLIIQQAGGNISLKDGLPVAHIHAVCTDLDGKPIGGNLEEGCLIFSGEFFLQELIGENLVRKYDESTGLYLWDIE